MGDGMQIHGRWAVAALLALGVGSPATAGSSSAPMATNPLDVGRSTFVITTRSGNAVVHIGKSDSFVAGVLSPEANAEIRRFLGQRHAPPVRFVLAVDAPGAARYGDGGWGRAGAITIAQERLRSQMTADMKPDASEAGAALPILGFSNVQQMYLSDGEVHAVYQLDGPRNADVSVHLENAKVLFLGTLYTADGYPDLTPDDGGSLDGLIKTIDYFSDAFASEEGIHLVPGRGAVSTPNALIEYSAMLRLVRDRLLGLIDAGRSDQEILAAAPLSDLDVRWGHGPVSTTEFTALALRSLRKR